MRLLDIGLYPPEIVEPEIDVGAGNPAEEMLLLKDALVILEIGVLTLIGLATGRLCRPIITPYLNA